MAENQGKRGGHWGRIAFVDLGSIADDPLPERFFEEPISEGKYRGHVLDRSEFKKALELYDSMSGFESDGWPTEAKLAELELNWLLTSR